MFWSHKSLHQEVPKHSKQHPWLLLNGALKYLDIIIILWVFFSVLIKTQVVLSPFVPVEFLVFHFCESPFDQSRCQKMPIETVSILTAGLCGCSHDPSVPQTNDRLQSCLKSTSRPQVFLPPSSLPKTDNERRSSASPPRENCEKIWITPVHFYLTNLSAVDTVEFWSFQMIHGHTGCRVMFF